MRVCARARAAAFLAVGCVLAGSAVHAQVKPATTSGREKQPPTGQPVFVKEGEPIRLEIYNGPIRTVRYYAGDSRLQQDALRNLERAENQVALADQLLALRQQYVNDEAYVQARRRATQETIYGFSTPLDAADIDVAQTFFRFPFYGAYPSYAATTLAGGWGGYAGAPYGSYGAGYRGYRNPAPASELAAYGVLEDSSIKSEVARSLAQQATPDYVARVTRDYQTALAQADRFEGLRTALNLPSQGITQVSFGARSGDPVVVMLKDGSKVEGSLVSEGSDWVKVQTRDGVSTIATGEIKMMSTPVQKPMNKVP